MATAITPLGPIPISLSTVAAKLSEAVGLLGATLYGLGLLRISGELEELHLSTPTTLAGMAHMDVLMKGVGVLASQSSAAVMIILSLVMFLVPSASARLDAWLTAELNLAHSAVAASWLFGAALLLFARWWEGVTYVAIVLLVLGFKRYKREGLGRTAWIVILLTGIVFVGVLGSFSHTPPLMTATVATSGDGEPLNGMLIGRGSDGEWYVAHEEKSGGWNLEVVGGATDDPESITIHPAEDGSYRTLAFEIKEQLT